MHGGPWDAIVIGSGPLGAAAARRLAEHGQRVAIVERGGPISDPPGGHVRNAERFQSDPEAFLPGIEPFLDYLDSDAPPEGLPGACVSSALGGQGVLWTNNCPRPVAGVGRPDVMDDAEWDRYLACAEAYLGARSDQFGGSIRHRRVADRLRPGLEASGRALVNQAMAGRLIDATHIHYGATADILGQCPAGVVVHRGEARLRLEGRRCALTVNGARVTAGAIVVAAGAIDTPRMLWDAEIRPGALGTHLTYHPVIAAQILLDDGLWSDASAPDPPPRLQIPPTPDHPWNTMVLRDLTPFPPDPADAAVPGNRLIELQQFCAVEPHRDNRMAFGPHGAVRFDVPLRPADVERRARMMDDAHALGAALGRFRRGCEPGGMAPGFAHLMGTCRMSAEDDGSGVADADGRVWGMDNLFLATVGLIPTAMAVNPTLTGVALAIRSADRVAGVVPEVAPAA